ncbi:hypothetical protein ACFYWX_43410 [Streptomyces sp. NPDC002888]|uniref:hypothetical protein n=1 Tax=Streptomyces sp. NPDC002888 TaxID=3364668 RepID=UPI0036AF5562
MRTLETRDRHHTQDTRADLLGIYLNDHLAGSTAGVDRARSLAEAEQDTALGADMGPLSDEIAEDRATLLEIMRRLDVPVRRYKVVASHLAERAGRLKTNGRLLHRSPLTSLIELELLRAGVTGKTALWEALRRLTDEEERLDAGQLDTLLERAHGQLRTLERLHAQQTAQTFQQTPDGSHRPD